MNCRWLASQPSWRIAEWYRTASGYSFGHVACCVLVSASGCLALTLFRCAGFGPSASERSFDSGLAACRLAIARWGHGCRHAGSKIVDFDGFCG